LPGISARTAARFEVNFWVHADVIDVIQEMPMSTQDKKLDKAIEKSFPASDPVTVGKATGTEPAKRPSPRSRWRRPSAAKATRIAMPQRPLMRIRRHGTRSVVSAEAIMSSASWTNL
jgi:hypothetical protein